MEEVATSPHPLEIEELKEQLRIAKEALTEIVECDYRGNRPHEQEIALEALYKIIWH